MFEKNNIDYYNLVRKDVLSLLPKEISVNNVLELGCGEGYTLEFVKSTFNAQKTTGVEINPQAAQSARLRVDVVLNQSAEEPLDLPEQEFDLVLCLDVLEHLYDPWKVLADLKKHIKPGGYLLASIPNVQHWSVVKMLLRGRWDYKKAGLMDETHIRFFTVKTAKEMLQFSDFGIINIKKTMGPEVRFFDIATFGVFKNFLTYHIYISAQTR